MSGTSFISSLSFPDFVDTVQRMHDMNEGLVKDLEAAKSLYKMDDIPKNTGTQRIYDEYDTETYARLKIEGGDASKVQAIKGYTKTMYMRRMAAEIDITWEMRNTGKDQEIVRRMTSLAKYLPQRMALDLTHRFTFATSTAYTDMDGDSIDVTTGDSLALISAVHTLTGTSTTYSNVVTGNPFFSKGAYQIARSQANTQILSNFGERRVVDFNTVVTGDDPDTIDEVQILFKSKTDPTQNNPGVVNTYLDGSRHVILPRLATTATGAYDSTKAKWWFYVAVSEWQAHLGIWEAPNLKVPSTSNNGEDIHNDNWTFGTRGAYGICIVVGRGIIGSCPTT